MSFNITSNMKQVIKNTEKVSKNIRKAHTRAINRTATQTRTHVSKITRQIYNVKARDIKAKSKIKKATFTKLEAIINYEDKRRSLLFYGARQTNKGVKVKVKKSGGRKLISHAFIKTIKGGKQVWRRVHINGKRVGRTPIEPDKGPSVAQLVNNETVSKSTKAFINVVFAKRMKHEIGRINKSIK